MSGCRSHRDGINVPGDKEMDLCVRSEMDVAGGNGDASGRVALDRENGTQLKNKVWANREVANTANGSWLCDTQVSARLHELVS